MHRTAAPDTPRAERKLGVRIADGRAAGPAARGRLARLTALALLACCGASLTLAVQAGWRLRTERLTLERENRAQAQREMSESGARIGEALSGIAPLTEALAARIANGPLPGEAELERLLSEALERHPELHGVGIAFAPHAFSAQRRLYAPYVMRRADGSFHAYDVGRAYDYTAFENEWYWRPRFDGAGWNEPYFEESTGEIVIEYGMPVHLPGSDPAATLPDAVVFGNYFVRELDLLVRRMGFGHSSYGFLFSADGHFISHPRRDYLRRERVVPGRGPVMDTQTIFEVALARRDTALHALGVSTINGRDRIVEYRDPVTGQEAWIAYGPVPGPGWTVAGVTLLDDLAPDSDATRRTLLRITGFTLLGGLALGGGLLLSPPRPAARRRHNGKRRRTRRWLDERTLWIAAGAVSLSFLAGIALVWHFALRHPPAEAEGEVRLADLAVLQRATEREGGMLRGGVRIPTGVFIRSVEFRSGVTVYLTGSIWQKYSLAEHQGIARSVVLPEGQGVTLVEVSRVSDGEVETVEWAFAGEFRQEFDYEHFPIDRHEVWLRMTHGDHRGNVFLTPDLEAYPITNPAALPGLADGLVLPGWRVEGSFFSYREHTYSTNFGDSGFGFDGERPELYFNVVVRREFVQPFISNVIPLLVALSMLFAMLLLSTKRPADTPLRGFTAMEVVLGCTALFFVVVFQHIAMRNDIPSQRIIYMEYFYFATYLGLLMVSLNAIVFACSSRVRWLQLRDNLAPKLLFWPVYLKVALVVTLWAFY